MKLPFINKGIFEHIKIQLKEGNRLIYILAFEHVRVALLFFFRKKLIICINYSFGLIYFPIKKKSRGVMSVKHLW